MNWLKVPLYVKPILSLVSGNHALAVPNLFNMKFYQLKCNL